MSNGEVMGKISNALDMEPLVVGETEDNQELEVIGGELVESEERELSPADQEADASALTA